MQGTCYEERKIIKVREHESYRYLASTKQVVLLVLPIDSSIVGDTDD